MVNGASVWPMKMLAATLVDSCAAGAHHPLHPLGHGFHEDLHHAEVVEDREQRGDEDDDGQNLEGEDYAERPALGPQWTEHELAARFGILQQRIDSGAGGFKHETEIGFENQEGEGELEAEPPEDDPRLNRAAVLGESESGCEDKNDPQQPRESSHRTLMIQQVSRAVIAARYLRADDFQDELALFGPAARRCGNASSTCCAASSTCSSLV